MFEVQTVMVESAKGRNPHFQGQRIGTRLEKVVSADLVNG